MTIKLDPAGLPRLIGLNGQARSGKDTTADYLVKTYGYEKAAFADVLRACARAVNPIIGYDTLGPIRWTQLFDELGYEAAKDHPEFGQEFRRVLLTMGTEMGRKVLGENVWVNALLDRLEPGKLYVAADCRFPNEAEAITERGGAVIRIVRPGLPRIDHPSETSLDLWDFRGIIGNDGTIEQLYDRIDELMAVLALGRPVEA